MSHYSIPDSVHRQLLAPRGAAPVRRMSGGLSGAQVWQCTSPLGSFCLRRWPSTYPAPSDLTRIHAAMQMASDTGLEFVPRIARTSDGQTFVRAGKQLWELTQWMPGIADYLAQPSEKKASEKKASDEKPSDEKLAAAMRALAQLHRAWEPTRVLGPSPAIANRIKRLEAWLAAESQVPSRVASSEATAQERALANRTLYELQRRGPELLRALREVALQPTSLQFVLRDIWSDHVLFSGQQVTGIIDYGGARLDEPATDVARLLGSLEPACRSRRIQGLANYCQAAHSHDMPRIDFARVDLLDRSGTLLSAAQWMEWLVFERRQFNAQHAALVARWSSFLERLQTNG